MMREQLDQAYYFYDIGKWNRSIEILDGIKWTTVVEAMEVYTLYAWNYWKKGRKDNAKYYWTIVSNNKMATDEIKSSAFAGLSIFYADKKENEKALKYVQLAEEMMPRIVSSYQNKIYNSLGIALALIGEFEKAMEILKRVAGINEQLMNSNDSSVAKEAKHQLAKNYYNLATLIYQKLGDIKAAFTALANVVRLYKEVGAETDLAAAYHGVAFTYEMKAEEEAEDETKKQLLKNALKYEKLSADIWKKHEQTVPQRIEMAEKNINGINSKIALLIVFVALVCIPIMRILNSDVSGCKTTSIEASFFFTKKMIR